MVNAKKIEVSASSTLTQTDNVDLNQNNKSESINTLSVGANINLESKKSQLIAKYNIYRTKYFNNKNKNKTYNELSLNASTKQMKDALIINAQAKVDNVNNLLTDNSNNNLIYNNTVQTRALSTDLSFKTNPRKKITASGCFSCS